MTRQWSISSFNVYTIVKTSSTAYYRPRVSLLKRSSSKSSYGIWAWPARCKKRVWKVKKVSVIFMFKAL